MSYMPSERAECSGSDTSAAYSPRSNADVYLGVYLTCLPAN
jgi:hypothetical protein